MARPCRPGRRYSARMRVVAGEFGGRKLVSPEGTSTRPTTDRVREAVFNALGSAGILDGAVVADLFAGTGAVGIEALSRGAARCTFVERDRSALRSLEENLDTLGLDARSRVMRSDAAQAASTLDVDIVFADPPYDFDGWDALLASVRAGFIVAESGRPLEAPDGWELVRSKRYGRAWVSFLERSAQ
ncbi:16S rRNA (guanine(966)-N(2))-methyltransferase RsmD [Ilumatobacter sp.]|uniref:16S rRNA (guanine(966)-N(2))-methyltransferase RsmD n=1 Tax=Ilumatobacter sp. TaxID=1967498 RepID=UPI003C49CBCC